MIGGGLYLLPYDVDARDDVGIEASGLSITGGIVPHDGGNYRGFNGLWGEPALWRPLREFERLLAP